MDLGAVLDGLSFGWSVLGLGRFGVLVFMECFCNETWDVRFECAFVVVPFEVDSDV